MSGNYKYTRHVIYATINILYMSGNNKYTFRYMSGNYKYTRHVINTTININIYIINILSGVSSRPVTAAHALSLAGWINVSLSWTSTAP